MPKKRPRSEQATSLSRRSLSGSTTFLINRSNKAAREVIVPDLNAKPARWPVGEQKELEALFVSQNKSQDQNNTAIPATFIRVTVKHS